MDQLFRRSTCKALVITCSDFRFKSSERALAEAAGLIDDYDLIARPGATRPLVAPKSDAATATLEEEIRLLHGVHGFPRVLLVHHVSCRAYDDIADPSNELGIHREHLLSAMRRVAEIVPGTVAEAYVIDASGAAQRITP